MKRRTAFVLMLLVAAAAPPAGAAKRIASPHFVTYATDRADDFLTVWH
jgi:hypothetical protein